MSGFNAGRPIRLHVLFDCASYSLVCPTRLRGARLSYRSIACCLASGNTIVVDFAVEQLFDALRIACLA